MTRNGSGRSKALILIVVVVAIVLLVAPLQVRDTNSSSRTTTTATTSDNRRIATNNRNDRIEEASPPTQELLLEEKQKHNMNDTTASSGDDSEQSQPTAITTTDSSTTQNSTTTQGAETATSIRSSSNTSTPAMKNKTKVEPLKKFSGVRKTLYTKTTFAYRPSKPNSSSPLVSNAFMNSNPELVREFSWVLDELNASTRLPPLKHIPLGVGVAAKRTGAFRLRDDEGDIVVDDMFPDEYEVKDGLPIVPSLTETGRVYNATKGAPLLSLLFCPRGFIGDYLKGSVNNTVMKPRRKMGEITSWDPMMRSFVSLGCRVRVSSDCKSVDNFLYENEFGDKKIVEERLVVVDELTSWAIWRSKQCRNGNTKKKTVIVGWDKAVIHVPVRMITTFRAGEGAPAIGSYTHCPYKGEPKEFYGVLWGKLNQDSWVNSVVRDVMEYTGVPMLSTCVEGCDTETINFPFLPAANYKRMIAKALFVVGVRAPHVGASIPEVLACGTHIISASRSFSSEHRSHPLVRVASSRTKMVNEIIRIVERFLEGVENQTMTPKNDGNTSTAMSAKQRNKLLAAEQKKYALADRFTSEGHKRNIQSLFGLDDECHIVNKNAVALRQLREASYDAHSLRKRDACVEGR